MEETITVQIGDSETAVRVLQIGGSSWLARATRSDGERVEFSGDDPDYAVEIVKQSLLRFDETMLDAA